MSEVKRIRENLEYGTYNTAFSVFKNSLADNFYVLGDTIMNVSPEGRHITEPFEIKALISEISSEVFPQEEMRFPTPHSIIYIADVDDLLSQFPEDEASELVQHLLNIQINGATTGVLAHYHFVI